MVALKAVCLVECLAVDWVAMKAATRVDSTVDYLAAWMVEKTAGNLVG